MSFHKKTAHGCTSYLLDSYIKKEEIAKGMIIKEAVWF